MSEVLLGVLRMPPELWSGEPLDVHQRHSCYVEAADKIERLRAEVAELRPELNAWVKRAMKEADSRRSAEAERDRLRELLREWRDPSIDGIGREELIKRTDAALKEGE